MPRGSSLSAPTGMQLPGEVGSAQNWQVPEQAVRQQTPSTQKWDEHSLAEAQTAPGGFGPQEPLLQTLFVSQSPSL
jgi:hypothetical protein